MNKVPNQTIRFYRQNLKKSSLIWKSCWTWDGNSLCFWISWKYMVAACIHIYFHCIHKNVVKFYVPWNVFVCSHLPAFQGILFITWRLDFLLLRHSWTIKYHTVNVKEMMLPFCHRHWNESKRSRKQEKGHSRHAHHIFVSAIKWQWSVYP